MAIAQLGPGTRSYIGLAADTKPASDTGAIFYETDTGDWFIYNGAAWVAYDYPLVAGLTVGAVADGEFLKRVGATLVGAAAGGGGTPGGADTQVQFNDADAFGGDAGLVYDKTTNILTVAGAVEPATDGDEYLGSPTKKWAAGYIVAVKNADDENILNSTPSQTYLSSPGSGGSMSRLEANKDGDINITPATAGGLSLYADNGAADGSILILAENNFGEDIRIFGNVFFRGAIVAKSNSAPADADLSNSSCAIWFDATNGAPKLMFKGKQANGTVVTGEVALA